MTLEKITTQTFDKEITENKLVLVDCTAEWCAPCRAQKPILEKFGEKNAGNLKIMLLDIEENPEIAQKYKISSIPCMLWFYGGTLVSREVGLKKEAQLEEALAHVVTV